VSVKCLVCAGSRKIRLPLRYPLSASLSDAEMTVDPRPMYKEFACPECAPKVPEERVAILEFHAAVSAMIDDPGYEKHAREAAAHNMVSLLLRDGFIQFRKGPVNEIDMRYELTGRLGVVSTAVVALMEERIAERQTEVAREVEERAIEAVANWGSYYTGNEGTIFKSQAIDAISRAAKWVFADRDKRRAALLSANGGET
jgi:hypothetical protein